jgi:adenylate cyclase
MTTIYLKPDDKKLRASSSLTIKELALENEIPLTHMCGGKGRYTIFRLQIDKGLGNCTKKTKLEEFIADFMNFPPQKRLACQIKVKQGHVEATRIVQKKADIDQTNRFAIFNIA